MKFNTFNFRIVFFIFLFFLVFNSFSVFSYDSFVEKKLSITIVDKNVFFDYIFLFNNDSVNNFSLSVPNIDDSKILLAVDDSGFLKYYSFKDKYFFYLNNFSGFKIVNVKLKFDNYITCNEKKCVFLFNNYDNSFFKVLNVYIPNVDEEDIISIYPYEPFNNGSIRFYDFDSDRIEIQFKNKNVNYSFFVFTFFLFVLFLFLFFVFYKKYSLNKKLYKSSLFNNIDKKVLELVILNPGITQKDIRLKLDLNKSHLSKIIKRLEFNGLLRKEKEGKIVRLFVGDKLK